MSKIIIETLSPIHIGSGNFLQNNTDFVVETINNESTIHIIDEQKILSLIGEERIDDWMRSIEKKESTLNLIKRLSNQTITAQDFSKHAIACYEPNITADNTLKEIMYNGMGKPYIPGSSIKGAIRTTILAKLALDFNKEEIKKNIILKDRNGNTKIDRYGNTLLSAEKIEKYFFGEDPYHDVFRFIRVGDAHFGKDSTIAIKMVNLNIRQHDELLDFKSSQLIEAIYTDEQVELDLHIAKDYYDFVHTSFPSIGQLVPKIETVSNLFILINEITNKLIEEEIQYWSEINITGAEDYIERMNEILDEIENCQEGKSCVLRIGHGSGWRFITGAWTEKIEDFNSLIPNIARPRNFNYSQYDFPKTRRVDVTGEVLGFVKLTTVGK